MTGSAELTLAAGFEPATREAWLALVDRVLNGGDFEKRLVSKTADGLRIEPLYTRAGSVACITGTAPPRPGWDIRTIVIETDPCAANAAILEDLEGGATSIALHIAPDGGLGLAPTKDAMSAALSGVILDMCTVALVPFGAFWAAATNLDAVWAERGIAREKRAGAFGADPLGTLAVMGSLDEPLERALASTATLAKMTLSMPGVTAVIADGIPYHASGASEAQELAAVLATLVAYLRACEAENFAPRYALPKIVLGLAADADQFLTIAKFRAARRLVARIAEACGAAEIASKVQIASAPSYRMMTRRDPWTNILRGAMACAGAALGGADAITVLPFTFALGKPDRFARRVARNTQLVLMEEASLGRVSDPASGSWYVESLTHDLADKAWTLFQSIEARGGMAAALTSGFIQDEIARTAEARGTDIATRRIELTGISAFPKLGRDGVEVEPWPSGAPSGATRAIEVALLRPQRLAEPFEALRDTAEGAGTVSRREGTGVDSVPTPGILDSPAPNFPRIFLASLGAIADHNQRSAWTQNLLAAGGIEAIVTDGYKTPKDAAEAFQASGATVACIASSDAITAAMGEDTARALRSAGARCVVMAGRPGDREAQLRAAGVGAFLFSGQDVVAALRGLHELLGIRH